MMTPPPPIVADKEREKLREGASRKPQTRPSVGGCTLQRLSFVIAIVCCELASAAPWEKARMQIASSCLSP